MPGSQPSSPRSSPSSYLARLSLFDAAMAVVGGIIGAGIFQNPAIVAARVGTSSLVIATWVLGAVVAIAGALVFAELGARRSQAGGGYVYLRDAFGPLPAFLYGWALLFVINTGAIAAVAITFAQYAADLLGLPDRSARPLAVGAILGLSIINYLGVRSGALVQNLLTVLKLAALALLITVGLVTSAHVPASPAPPPLAAPADAWAVFMAVGAALIPILFAYGGWQNTNFIAAEIRDAQRQLPRALVLGVAIVVLVYVLVNVAYLRVLGVGGLAASRAPASEVMRAGLGTTGGTIIAAGIVASTFGFLNLVILTAPRVYQAMAADGLFFQSVARLHPRYRTPSVALGLQAAASLAVLLTGGYAQLVNFNTVGDWIFFGLTGTTIFAFRRRDRRPGAPPRPAFLMPFHPWPSILFCLAALYAVISAIRTSPINAAIAVGLIALGIPAYALGRSRLRATETAVYARQED